MTAIKIDDNTAESLRKHAISAEFNSWILPAVILIDVFCIFLLLYWDMSAPLYTFLIMMTPFFGLSRVFSFKRNLSSLGVAGVPAFVVLLSILTLVPLSKVDRAVKSIDQMKRNPASVESVRDLCAKELADYAAYPQIKKRCSF